MTYGDLKLRLTQMFPSVGLDLLEGWAQDRYAELLGELPWSHQDYSSVLQTTAAFTTGTVTVTEGSAAVQLAGAEWSASMAGRAFRVTGRNEWYAFSYADATDGILDRPYEGPTTTGAGYSIFQHIYQLASDCRLLQNDAFDGLKRYSRSQLDATDRHRVANGEPCIWVSYMDDSSVPPLMQVELYPVPQVAHGIPYTYSGEAAPLTSTSAPVQAWLQPTALVEGVVARVKRHLKDYPGAAAAEVAALAALKNMRSSEAQGMAPGEMRIDEFFTRHRAKRWRY